ncbi:hypothetical protein PG997_010681 [Apiospora hydei]|uniref:Uncharacterized protein n=1 Tax=Apiospora hydei TaxID=1337664 RepID=A0ABR1VH12_9PEZI
MSQLTQFHLFPNLPLELQTLIWQKYDDEVDPIIWHEFHYSSPDGLEGVQSYRVRRPGDGSCTDDEQHKKNVSTALSPSAGVNLSLHPFVRGDERGHGPASFRARLDLDVFYFTISARYENLLGFLSPCAAGEKPKPLDDDHWFFKIRKLAIYVSGDFSQDWRGCDFDRDALGRHRGLSVIYIVLDTKVYSEKLSLWEQGIRDGFAHRVWRSYAPGIHGFIKAIYKDQAVKPDIHLVAE